MDNKVNTELRDLRVLNWSKIRNTSGTAGTFLKAQKTVRGRKIYYKLSDFDAYSGIVGHECVNEIIADRLLTLLKIPHLSYKLIHALICIENREYETWLCASEDYRLPGESKAALDVYYQLERREGESPLDFCIRLGWGGYVYRMLIADFLMLNRDRHGANMEVLRDPASKTCRLAPLFDNGLSFFFSVHDEKALAKEDPMEDKRVQCFVGGNSAERNLQLIPEDQRKLEGSLYKNDREYLFYGLDDAFPKAYRDAVWDMLMKRWEFYESFCDKR